MKTLRGNQLAPSEKQKAFARHVYRNTVENRERAKIANSILPPITDQQWLEITAFAVTKSGKLDERYKHCFTNHSEIPEWKAIIHGSR